ncbi:MAG TPA: HD domain-containing phosphohydrolase [Gemmataceae bacterium]|jgi:putative nucleotidyltransferase with HDIG domain|nr:HD domain-containing phosphohydrolase [Gemmataceae bacterium]
MLVEDEPCVLDVLTRAARGWNFDCRTAICAEDAVRLLEAQPSPVVVTDLRMPGKGGSWLIGEIQRRWPETLVIVVTGIEDEETLNHCLQAGAHYFFLKPIKLDEFHNALRFAFASQRLRRERDQSRQKLERKLVSRTRHLRSTFVSAIHSLVRTLEARDPSTAQHSIRVRHLAGRLAESLGMSEKPLRQVRLAAKLHDIGKVGVAEGILNKIGSLTEEEYGCVRDHPMIGERILTPIIRNRTVLQGIRHHHERYDGSGYPDGLAGDRIPLIARIVTIADCFDAMTSIRTYRTALDVEAALDVMRSAAGTQFDPGLVPIFEEIVRAEFAGVT